MIKTTGAFWGVKNQEALTPGWPAWWPTQTNPESPRGEGEQEYPEWLTPKAEEHGPCIRALRD